MIARILLVMALLLLSPTVSAQTFPKLTGRVVDTADMIDAGQKAALNSKLAALERESGRQLVVVTLPDLQDYDIADYGYRLGRSWGIGEKGKNTGALLIVAKAERKMRIEVGYGLEGVLTDALSKRIISTVITPRFKSGDIAGGLNAGVDSIAELIKLPPEEAAKRVAEADRAERSRSNDGASPGMVIFWLIIILFFVIPLARRFGGNGRRYRSGGLPVILWGPGLGSGWGSDNSGGGGSSWGGFGGGGGFSGGGGSFGGGGASGDW